MSDQRKRQFSNRARPLKGILRFAFGLVGIAIAILMVVLTWNDTAAATGDVPMRIFFVGWAVAAVILSVEFLFTDLLSRRLPLAVH